jgi:proteasome accessory factor B
MANVDTYVRAVEVHRLIKSGEAVNSTSIAERFELSQRHAQRIVEFLQNQLGAPVEYDARKRTYYYSEPTFELPSRIMSEGEAVAIIVAHRALLTQQATPLGGRLFKALNTLRELLPETVSLNASDLLEKVSFEPSPTRRIDAGILDVLVGSLERRETVRMDYYAAHTDSVAEREVDLYHLTNRRGDWYAVGFCHMRNGLRTFAVSRIRAVEPVPETRYEVPADFDATTYFGSSLGVDSSGTPSLVVLEFDSYEARWIAERTWHASQRTERLEDGGLRLTLEVRPGPELVQWVMSHGAHVRVIAPSSLAADVARLHREAAALYPAP